MGHSHRRLEKGNCYRDALSKIPAVPCPLEFFWFFKLNLKIKLNFCYFAIEKANNKINHNKINALWRLNALIKIYFVQTKIR